MTRRRLLNGRRSSGSTEGGLGFLFQITDLICCQVLNCKISDGMGRYDTDNIETVHVVNVVAYAVTRL